MRLKITLITLLLLTLMWMGGFGWYLHTIYHLEKYEGPSDGIVILTGGANRIHEGLSLLNKKKLPLLISGIRSASPLLDNETCYIQNKDIVTLGTQATSTQENAQETKAWATQYRCGSLRVVTSHYHMPRSLLELKLMMPHVTLHPYPVISFRFHGKTWLLDLSIWKLLFMEYNKYLVVLAQSHLI